jgi:excisionase family DNA binding protein
MQNIEGRPIEIQRFLYSLDQASEALGGLGKTTIFELIKTGALKVVRIGRRTFISQNALTEFVSANELKSEVSNAAV